MSQNISELHPVLQSKVYQLIRECKKKGLTIGISECVRTVAEQDALYAKGRTAPGNKVTNAKGSSYSSMHQWGVAFDFYRNDGKGVYEDKDGFFKKVGEIGQSIGLEWGGSWKSIVDKPHFQLPHWGSGTSTLKRNYRTPDKFRKTWPTVPGEATENETFKVVKASYLRTSPALGDNKVKYTDKLPAAIKKICEPDDKGYAKLKVGATYGRVRICYIPDAIFHQCKNKYWICREYKNKAYTKQK